MEGDGESLQELWAYSSNSGGSPMVFVTYSSILKVRDLSENLFDGKAEPESSALFTSDRVSQTLQ